MRSMFLLVLYKAVANGMKVTAISAIARAVKEAVKLVKRRLRR